MEKYLNIFPVYFTWRFWGGEITWENIPFLMSGTTQGEENVAREVIRQTLEKYDKEKVLSCSKFQIKVHSPRVEIPKDDLMCYTKKITSEVIRQLTVMRQSTPANA